MNRWLLGLLFLAATAAAQERSGLRTYSSNGLYSLQLFVDGSGHCRAESFKAQSTHFKLAQCLGTVDDVGFISANGARFWVLVALPDKRRGKLAQLVVAKLYDTAGNLVRVRRLGEFVQGRDGYRKLRHLQRYVQWLGGVAGEPGKAPFVTGPEHRAPEQLVFETLQPRSYTLRF